ncbi:MAG: DUF86 domain-containing protein [Bacteroidetes bacterium]|nr:DUF86 domain-containing protein [Bacteroidota bacterium]MCL5266619.1 DUF86 domain-containing protein [Bacteroidota bacterium]
MSKSANGILKKQSILPRIDGIQRDLIKLKELSKLPVEEFSLENNFVLSQFYLRRALEGVFHIGGHILSRIPGNRAVEYKQIAIRLGEVGIVSLEFAKGELKQMAGYRNRLTHFYADVTSEEIYKVVNNDLVNIEAFLASIKRVLDDPQKFGLSLV